MVRELTYKQKEFCKNVVNGCGYRESYMKAYNCKSETAASIEATKLLKRDDITEYIKALNKPINNAFENKIINERQQQIDFIKGRIQECIKKEDEQSLIRWNDQLNKILSLYKDTETEQKDDNKLNNIDTATLIKLSGVS